MASLIISDRLLAVAVDREAKLVERGKLDDQRADFARRAALESAEYVPPADAEAAPAPAAAVPADSDDASPAAADDADAAGPAPGS
jgi:hypothetical protein